MLATRSNQIISGIAGVVPGGAAQIVMPVNQRYHRLKFSVLDGAPGAQIPVAPDLVIGAVEHRVGSNLVRDIGPDDIINIAKTNGYTPEVGELPIFFSEPWRRFTEHETVTSWDMFGQSSYQIRMPILATALNPIIVGKMEFDLLRNAIPPGKGKNKSNVAQPFLSPIKQHTYSFPLPLGVSDIQNIPTTFPIQRMFLESGIGTSIGYVQVLADGNTVHEGTPDDNAREIEQYGFDSSIYEYPLIFDKSNHLREALKIAKTLLVRVTMTAADNVFVVLESRPPGYK